MEIQLTSAALAVAALLVAWRYAGHELSLQVTIVASQLISSPLRDHYAVLLLLPTAWLVQRGRTWAVVFPLAGWIALFADSGSAASSAGLATSSAASGSWIAAATVPLIFFCCLAALLWETLLDRRSTPAITFGDLA
jgi:hypothetical protein